VGILILILLVFGIHSCQVSRKHSAFRNYNRDVSALLQESDQQSGELFNLLRNPSGNSANPVDVTNNANGVRVQAEQLVDRAGGTGHPGELNAAQRYLLETLEFRRDGIANIATQLRTALGDQGRQGAVNAIAAQMRNFDASDVIYSQRFIPEFEKQFKKQGLQDEAQVPKSAFLPDIAWIDPTTVADRIARIRGGSSASGPVAPGLHGTSLGTVVVKPGGQTLSTSQAVAIPSSANTSFDVQVTNGGDNDESNVTVRQPLGADTNVAVDPPSSWRLGRTLQATAIAPDGKTVGAAGGELRNGVFVLPYARELNDHPVAAYRITVGA